MKSSLTVAVVAALSCFSTHSLAQDKNASLTDIDSLVRDAYTEINGKEVQIDGAIGAFIGDQLYFADETGRYIVSLDAGRDVRRQIEGCEINLFDLDASPCQLIGMAEIRIDDGDDDIGDGLEIRLILYRVDSFENAGS